MQTAYLATSRMEIHVSPVLKENPLWIISPVYPALLDNTITAPRSITVSHVLLDPPPQNLEL